jgi:hypothetical protein
MDLFKRLPRFRPRSGQEQHIIPQADKLHYPAFTEDFEILEKELMPHFRALDNEAIRQQNAYRWMYVILIFGTALTTIIAIVQLALKIDGLGIVEAIIASGLIIATLTIQSFHFHERFLNARLATEHLRSEYFLFLGHLEPYEQSQDRISHLIQRVTDKRFEGECYDTARD